MKRLQMISLKTARGLLLALMVFGQTQIRAQRTLPGQQAVTLTAGTANGFNVHTQSRDFAFHGGLFFSVYGNHANYWKFGAEYLQTGCPYKNISVPLAQFTGEAGRFFNILADRSKTLFVPLGVSALAGYETINWNNKLLFDGARIQNKDAFVYGAAFTLEPQVFLCDRVALLLSVKERMLQNSSAKFNTQFGVGIKIAIN